MYGTAPTRGTSTHLDAAEVSFISSDRESWLAPYAMRSGQSAGRPHREPSLDPLRDVYEIDRDRIIRSAAFRRLAYKMQVFSQRGDYHRTRLTHTLEVAAVARTVGRGLRLNEDLIETLAMAHDLGHPPFGHCGEAALNDRLAGEGGFCHNRHGLRLLEQLERCHPRFPGLNLTRETLQGQYTRAAEDPSNESPLLEVQVVEAADNIAYDTHDADDALQLGLLTLDDLLEVSLWREAARRVQERYADLEEAELIRCVFQELIDWQISDLLRCTSETIRAAKITSTDDVRRHGWIVNNSDELEQRKTELERFLFTRVYRHPQILTVRQQATQCLESMFDHLLEHPDLLPEGFQSRFRLDGVPRCVGDYVAGMTDRYAWQQANVLVGDGARS
jgi:dGTPase